MYTAVLIFKASQNLISDQASHTPSTGSTSEYPNNDQIPFRKKTPESFIDQTYDWFSPGRVFSIWAHEDQEIHNKIFVLLDSKNKEGTGVLVQSLNESELRRLKYSSSAYRTHMKLCGYNDTHNHKMHEKTSPQGGNNSGGSGVQLEIAHMDQYSPRIVQQNTYILVEHTCNIPFVKYPCEDYGTLDSGSLEKLRLHYVDYLIHRFNLKSKITETYKKSSSMERSDL